MTDAIVIYRKNTPGKNWSDQYGPKGPTKAEKAHAAERLELVARVRRPELEQFLSDGFYGLEALPTKVIDNKAERLLNHRQSGWVIPAGSLGRNPEKIDRATAQSVLLWIKQNMGHVVNPDHVSIVVQPM